MMPLEAILTQLQQHETEENIFLAATNSFIPFRTTADQASWYDT